MWNPYARSDFLPLGQTHETASNPPSQPSVPPPAWTEIPSYPPPPLYPSNVRQLPIPPQPALPPRHNGHVTTPNFDMPSFPDNCDFLHPPIKVERDESSRLAPPETPFLAPFLPPTVRTTTPAQLPPFSSVPAAGLRGTRATPIPPCNPHIHHPGIACNPQEPTPPYYQPAAEIDPPSLQGRKRQRETPPAATPPPPPLPPIFAPPIPRSSPAFLSQPQQLPHHSQHPHHPPEPLRQTRQYTFDVPLPPGEEDNPNKRQRFSVVSTTSVRTNGNRPGYPVASTTTTTTTISTSTTTTTTSRSVSTTTTSPTLGPMSMLPSFFGGPVSVPGLPNPAMMMQNMLNRMRHDPRQPPMMPLMVDPQDVWGEPRGREEDDMRIAFNEFRHLMSRSSSMLHPFFQFRTARGGTYDDDDDEEEEEEEEEIPSFDQMNIPEIEFKEGQSEINEKLCVICQDEYKHGEKLSTLPCVHHFHTACIKKWVDECKPECPLCKAALA